MRTTLTLDDDVHRELESLCRERGQRLKVVLNDTLRAGLLALRSEVAEPSTRYETEPVDLGKSRLPDLDDIAEVLSIADGESSR